MPASRRLQGQPREMLTKPADEARFIVLWQQGLETASVLDHLAHTERRTERPEGTPGEPH
jgi:hypothetical protein